MFHETHEAMRCSERAAFSNHHCTVMLAPVPLCQRVCHLPQVNFHRRQKHGVRQPSDYVVWVKPST